MFTVLIGLSADRPARAEPLRLAVVEWGGLTYKDNNGQYTGPWFDIMTRIVASLGQDTELLVLPLPRIFRRLDIGETDLTLFTTNLGQKFLDMGNGHEPYHRVVLVHQETGIVIVGRKESQFTGYADLNGHRAAIGIGGCCFAGFSDNPKIEKLQVPDNVILKMVTAGRVEAGILLDLDYNFYVTHAGFNAADYSPPVVATPLEAWIHKTKHFKDNAALKRVTETVNRLRTQGVFDRILARYRPQS
ncbi:substrate-binding periplasmic protein [Aestuariispira insulae]|nr:transporter substrate-binding domain-containing protein [Aestuariispira insulae]